MYFIIATSGGQFENFQACERLRKDGRQLKKDTKSCLLASTCMHTNVYVHMCVFQAFDCPPRPPRALLHKLPLLVAAPGVDIPCDLPKPMQDQFCLIPDSQIIVARRTLLDCR